MRTGICTTDFSAEAMKNHQPQRSAEELFARVRELGFECVQFSFESVKEAEFVASGQLELPPEIAKTTIDTVLRASEKYKIPIRVFNGTFNMAHPSAEVRKEGVRRMEILAAAAREMGVPYISLCSGTANPDMLWAPSEKNDSSETWNRMFENMQRVVDIAEKYEVVMAIEAEPANVISSPGTARRVMDEIGSEKLKMILDCANLFPHGKAFREEVQAVIGRAFEAYGKDIVIAHGKDIFDSRESFDFCGTGLGIVDFAFTAEMLRKYQYTGDMFLHGISGEADMPRALSFWKNAAGM